MINAKEARQQVIQDIQTKASAELVEIEKVINIAINNGDFVCYCYFNIQRKTIEILKSLGYGVTDTSSQIDGVSFRISWEDK